MKKKKVIKKSKKVHSICFHVDTKLYKKIRNIRKEFKITQSDAVRICIEKF